MPSLTPTAWTLSSISPGHTDLPRVPETRFSMNGISRRAGTAGPTRRIPSSRSDRSRSAPKETANPRSRSTRGPTPHPARAAELRLDGRRLGSLRGGRLRITCICGHSGEVPVFALVTRHGKEARVSDAVASMRCGACAARRIQDVRWLDTDNRHASGLRQSPEADGIPCARNGKW